MELALNQTLVDCYAEVFSQTVRREESRDTVVPDTLPDIGEILGVSGTPLIRSKEVGEGRVRLEAELPAQVAYMPEEGDAPHCLEAELPFYLSVEDERIGEDCLCTAELSVTALEARLLNPRKVSIRAEAAFTLRCFSAEQLSFPGAPAQAAEGVNVLERPAVVTPVRVVAEKTFVLTDEREIPAGQSAAAELLNRDVQAQVEDVQTLGNKLIVKGSVRSSLLYAGEDGAGGLSFSTEFSQILETGELPEEAMVSASVLLSGVYYGLTGGEGRTLETELHGVIQVVVCARAEVPCLCDAYSSRWALETDTEEREQRRVSRTALLRETLRGQLETAGPVAELLSGSYTLGGAAENGEGAVLPVTVRACYRTADGGLHALKRGFSVSFPCETGEGQRLEIAQAGGQELLLTPSAGGLELRLPLELRVLVWEREALHCVTGLRYLEEEPLDLSEKPSAVVLRAGSGDDLWALAKANCSTVQAIRETNGLEELNAPWEKLILIPKTV